MIEIRKLKKEDMDELFALLNETFGHKYGRPMHFDLEQPKMWVRDDLHAERHIAVFEDGKMAAVVGIYPLPLVIGGEKFLFCTTGNVATLPQYEGKGYFSRLFPLAIEEAKRQGATAARLGGARQRYARYGFESCGPAYEYTVTDHNAKHTGLGADISLDEIRREDEGTLAYCHALMEKKTVFVERSTEEGYRDMYLALCSKEAKPYLVKKNGAPIGYISAKDGLATILEFSLEDEAEISAVAAAAALKSEGKRTRVTVSLAMPRAIAALQAMCQEYSAVLPSRFCIFEYERLVCRLLSLQAERMPLPSFDLVLQIEGGERLHLHADESASFCKTTNEAPDLTLPQTEAERLLFGLYNEDLLSALPREKQIAMRAVFPLPLTWTTNDFV